MSDRQISQTAKTLIEAKKLIEDEGNWCQGAFENGHQMCAAQAVWSINNEKNKPAYDALLAACGAVAVSEYNDNHTHTEVMEMFDLAIASEIEKGAGKP